MKITVSALGVKSEISIFLSKSSVWIERISVMFGIQQLSVVCEETIDLVPKVKYMKVNRI
jgi:hypothetical protein